MGGRGPDARRHGGRELFQPAGAALLAALMNGDLAVLRRTRTPSAVAVPLGAARFAARGQLGASAWPAVGTGGYPQL